MYQGTDPKAANTLGIDGELALLGLLEFLLLLLVHDAVDEVMGIPGRQGLVADVADDPIDLNARGRPAVMNMSDPFFWAMRMSSWLKSMMSRVSVEDPARLGVPLGAKTANQPKESLFWALDWASARVMRPCFSKSARF